MVKVLDTNVILDSSITELLETFDPCLVVIPLAVIQELDTFKKLEDGRGRNAREAIRFLDTLRKYGKLYEGVPIDNGTIVKVEVNHTDVELPPSLDKQLVDNRILMVAKGLMEAHDDVSIVTQDICERVIADTLGIKSEDYDVERIDVKNIYSGWTEITLDNSEVQELYEDNMIRTKRSWVPNQYFVMTDKIGGIHYGRYNANTSSIVKLNHNLAAWGVKPAKNNIEQMFLLDMLLNDNIKLVTAMGPSGTGKTLLSLAAGLQKTIEERKYEKIIAARSIVPVGDDIGYLPGGKEEKLIPWMGAIFDNLEWLTRDISISKYGSKNNNAPAKRVDELMSTGLIELEALIYVRGRSIPKQWIIIDESQNTTRSEMKTIISRAGEGTKIVITGDIEQVDNHRLNSANNGLVHVINSFMGSEIYSHITLTKTERSKLSELAVRLL